MIVNTEWGAFGDQGELDFILTRSVSSQFVFKNFVENIILFKHICWQIF